MQLRIYLILFNIVSDELPCDERIANTLDLNEIPFECYGIICENK